LICLALFIGCSDEAPVVELGPPLHPVTGRLTVGGKPAEGATLKFLPTAPAATGRIPTAVVGADGRFAASTRTNDDGAPEGSYKLLVIWMEEPPEGGFPRDRLRGKYFDEAKPVAVVTVKAGPNSIDPIDLRP